jgi:hypothetical protein
MFSLFCGTVLDVLTALEVRRKVCVAPLGLRALDTDVLASGSCSDGECAPGAVSVAQAQAQEGRRVRRQAGGYA